MRAAAVNVVLTECRSRSGICSLQAANAKVAVCSRLPHIRSPSPLSRFKNWNCKGFPLAARIRRSIVVAGDKNNSSSPPPHSEAVTVKTSEEQSSEGNGSAVAVVMSRLSRAAYIVAVTVGAAAPFAGASLYASGALPPHVWQLFLWCSLLGVTWELPLMVPGCIQSPVRLVRALSRPAFLLLLLVWSCWDGMVSLAGPWAACFLLPGPHFQSFNWLELAVVVIVSQAQSLFVEVLAATLGMWSYTAGSNWWDARLFTVAGGREIVTGPQLIWLAASLAIYAICLAINWPA